MPRFGTSEAEAFTSTGRLKLIAETDEMCTTCDGSANGPTNFWIIRESPSSVELICPNCGTQKNVFPPEVKRKLSPEEQARREALIAAATAKPAFATPKTDADLLKKAETDPRIAKAIGVSHMLSSAELTEMATTLAPMKRAVKKPATKRKPVQKKPGPKARPAKKVKARRAKR